MNYFSVNGLIGCGPYASPDFATPEEFIAHLDYLEIDRALVAGVDARDFSPNIGNRELLKTIAPFQERLRPVFYLTPADYFEYGTLAWLKEQAAAGNRVYRVCPAKSRFPLRQIERLLTELVPFSPLLLMDGSSCDSIADFEYLSGQYPEARWVVTQQMWSGFNGVLHLMWRRKNIYLDTSWLHMRDTLEMVRDEFGIERLLFGIGNRAQYGAAVAALAHAEFSDAEREAVAHGNLEKLLGLPPLEKKLFSATPQLAEKPLWNSFKAGGKLDGVRVVDSHVHDGPFTRGWVLRDYGRAALEKSMTRLGIDRHIVIGEQALFGDILRGNAEAEREFSPFSDRFKGYFVFNPHFKNTVNEKILDDFFSRGYFVGFKLLPAYWNVPMDDPGYELVWQYAEKHHLPILIHTWGDAEPLKNIAPRYPNARFLLGHSGGRDAGRKQSMEIAEAAPNTIFDTCAIFCSTLPFTEVIQRFGCERVTFGSDVNAHNEAYELGPFCHCRSRTQS